MIVKTDNDAKDIAQQEATAKARSEAKKKEFDDKNKVQVEAGEKFDSLSDSDLARKAFDELGYDATAVAGKLKDDGEEGRGYFKKIFVTQAEERRQLDKKPEEIKKRALEACMQSGSLMNESEVKAALKDKKEGRAKLSTHILRSKHMAVSEAQLSGTTPPGTAEARVVAGAKGDRQAAAAAASKRRRAVRWVPGEAERCMQCKPDWQFQSLPGYGRHHCRACGQVVCKTCMHGEIELTEWCTTEGLQRAENPTPQKVCKAS